MTPAGEPFHPAEWATNATYRQGVALFNGGEYWHAHEQFEKLWLAVGRTGPTADFFKGLIKLCASGVKHAAGQPEGVRSHATRAAALLRAVAPVLGDDYLGLSLPTLVVLADTVQREGWPADAPRFSLLESEPLA